MGNVETWPDMNKMNAVPLNEKLYLFKLIVSKDKDKVSVIYDKTCNMFNGTYLLKHCDKTPPNYIDNFQTNAFMEFVDSYAIYLRGKPHYSYNGKPIFIDHKPILEVCRKGRIKTSLLTEEDDNMIMKINSRNEIQHGVWLNYNLLPWFIKQICLEFKFFLDQRFLEYSGILDALQSNKPLAAEMEFTI